METSENMENVIPEKPSETATNDLSEKDIPEKEAVETENNEKNETECCDPYFYTKRDEFTSEIFKIEIESLPRLVGYSQIKKLLIKKMNLKPHKIKVIGKAPPLVFVTFRCEEDREQALKTICNFVWKGRKLFAKKANPMADPLVKKRKAEASTNEENVKKLRTEEPDEVSVTVMVKNAITPLWNLSYEDQLAGKQEEMHKFMCKMTRNLKSVNPVIFRTTSQQSEDNALCCPLLPIVGSPETRSYRNKCEFNIGLHPTSGEPAVGFRISSYKEGSKCVADASHCDNISEVMLKTAEVFQSYIRSSPLPVFNPENHEGFWRQLTVRTSRKDHLLLIVVLHPQTLSEEEIEAEKKKVQEFFLASELSVTSLYFQKFVKKTKDDPPLEHVYGSLFIEERLLEMDFRISPDAFFQVNTLGAELLYKTVAEFASLTKETTVLDLCCGTGAIGISLAKGVSKVIGIELCMSAVQDARHNVQANGIENAEFLCGKVEDQVFSVLSKAADDEDVVAILDPPRAGLSNKVIKAIRGMSKLKRIVYLSCSPQLAMTNFVDLCRPHSNNYRGSAFRPAKAMALDLFPGTNHCELILLFERK